MRGVEGIYTGMKDIDDIKCHEDIATYEIFKENGTSVSNLIWDRKPTIKKMIGMLHEFGKNKEVTLRYNEIIQTLDQNIDKAIEK